ncbi:LamG domain-containing protein [Parageobacillus galactosidasius]|uniref:LamG domain-containing protein n=1 Tax=Parageobacillus galactosidasius TaxID=883812 RepID=UPI00146C4308|nr:LamG domain-containing protein [Parageobacillus galactosidasius]
MAFDNYKFTIRLPSGGINSSDKTDNEWDQYIVNSTLNGAISTPGDNNVWNWSRIYSWTSTVNTRGSDYRTVRGSSSVSYSSDSTSNWISVFGGFRPVLLIESLYTPTVKYLFEDNGEVKKYDRYKNCYQFNGIDNSLEVPNSSSLTIDSFTVEAWVKVPSNGVGYLISNDAISISVKPTEVYVILKTPTGGTYESYTFPSIANKWSHIAVSFMNNSFLTVYLNGVKVRTSTNQNKHKSITSTWHIGKYYTGSYFFEGLVADLRIWNYARSESEIVANMKSLLNGTESGLILYYSFMEPTVIDKTSNKNNPTIINATYYQDRDISNSDPHVISEWVTLGLSPATESMFLTDGMDDLSIIDNNALQQLESDTPKLLMYIDDSNKTSASVNLTAVPKGQLIFQEGDIDVSAGVESLSVNATVQNLSTLKIIASVDGGVTWKTFNGATWQTITPDAASVKANGMTPDVVNGLTKEQINDLLQGSNTLRFAYYLEQDQLNDVVNVDDISITASPVATETPTLDSIKIVYDELTIEGRMQDLERINAINMAKLQFKSNALLQSDKYKLHDLVVDTFESISGVDISNTNAVYDAINKEFIYDTSDGAPAVQEVVLQEEDLPVYCKKFMLHTDHDGNIDYEYSLDGGMTWNPITPFTIIDLTGQTGTKLKVKAKLKDSTAKLRGIAFSWA